MEPGAATSHAPALATPPARLRPMVALGAAWRTFSAHVGISLGAALLFYVITLLGAFIPFVNIVFGILVTPALTAGGARFMTRVVRGESPTIDTLFDGFRRWPRATGAVLLQFAVTFAILSPVFVTLFGVVGFATLVSAARGGSPSPAIIVPVLVSMLVCYPFAAWWQCRSWPVYFVVLEPECTGAMDALRRSVRLTRGNVWRVIGLVLLGLPVVLVGLIALCVGVIPAAIVLYYAYAHAYEQLRGGPRLPAATAPAEDRPTGIVV